MTAPGVKFDLPGNLADKVAAFPEASYGVSLVTLILKNGKRIPHVHVAWGSQVIKATQPDDDAELSRLDPLDIADVLSEP
ncbi:MAG TPA: hypothetical protein VMP68_02045 [Candidatus Eisenbacteria bacterium]|nr:hypothetical protein [Candidatus Eisenbacteria bacterium]